MKMARLLALRIGRLYLTGEVEFHPAEGPEVGLSLISGLDGVDG